MGFLKWSGTLRMDYVLRWIKLLGWEQDTYLICTYMTPSSSSRRDIDTDGDKFLLLEQQIAKVCELGDVLCMGDFCAGTGDREDCIIGKR